ncbi:MAG: DNA-binding protein [Crenarchaeota archaeon]|nr:DNA-binding protein [Thermoproteota archaeon]
MLDTAAFLARLQLSLYGVELVTTPSVIEEVRDFESRLGLEISLEVSRVSVEEPSRDSIEVARRAASELGALEKLSRTDVDVLALAIDKARSGLEVAIATDDYSLQNVASYLGLAFLPVKTRGISSVRVFKRRSSSA